MEALERLLRDAFLIARGERLNVLRHGRRPRLFDARGMHPYSYVWGRIDQLIDSHPELEPQTTITPHQLEEQAYAEAKELYRQELFDEGTDA